MKYKIIAAGWLLILAFGGLNQTAFGWLPVPSEENRAVAADRFWRTELYFGMERTDGSEISDEDWTRFLAEEITLRFPAGFTVLESYGQFKNASGRIVRERSRVLILLYTKKEKRGSHKKIEQIRAAYKRQFRQQSVLRMDFPLSVLVSF